ncbi:Cfap97d1 [Symbiodinium natans]|uniref:Cfap97d1 protein n=1 Tax=Symbiodinium natans TaxID=878477 RepID=A0A812KS34_9DINO|nr:Cfap97d1 [Symbiodinium natans]
MPLGLVERAHHENPRYESLAHVRPTVDCGPPKALARPPRPPASFTARREAQVEAAVNDIKMIENIAREMARPPSLSVLERKGPMSLNTNQRRKELQRIDVENQRLLKRLESQKSAYSRRDHKSSYEQSRRHARLARAHRSNSPRSLPPLPSRRRDSGALQTPRSDGGQREDTEAKIGIPEGLEAEDTDGPEDLLEGPVRSRSLQPNLQQEKIEARIHSRDARAPRHVSPTAAKARGAAPAPAGARAPAQSRVSLPRLPQSQSRGSSPQPPRERSAPPGRRAAQPVPNKGTAAQRTSASARPAVRREGASESRSEAPKAKPELPATPHSPQKQVNAPASPAPEEAEPQEAAIPEAWEEPCSPADATTVEEVPEVVEDEDEPSSPSSLPPAEPISTTEFVAQPSASSASSASSAADTQGEAPSAVSPGKCGLPIEPAPLADEEVADSGDEAYSEDEDFCDEAEDESTPMSPGNMTGRSRSDAASDQEAPTPEGAEQAIEEHSKALQPVQRPSENSALSQESASQLQAHSLATKALSTSLSALVPGNEGPEAPSQPGSDTPTSVEGSGRSLDIPHDDGDVVSAHSDSEDES